MYTKIEGTFQHKKIGLIQSQSLKKIEARVQLACILSATIYLIAYTCVQLRLRPFRLTGVEEGTR
jgi:hypothetical protein